MIPTAANQGYDDWMAYWIERPKGYPVNPYPASTQQFKAYENGRKAAHDDYYRYTDTR